MVVRKPDWTGQSRPSIFPQTYRSVARSWPMMHPWECRFLNSRMKRCITTKRPSVCLRPLATDAIFYWVDERVYLLERLFKTLTLFLQFFLDGVRYRFIITVYLASNFYFVYYSRFILIFSYFYLFFLNVIYLLLWKIINFLFSI